MLVDVPPAGLTGKAGSSPSGPGRGEEARGLVIVIARGGGSAGQIGAGQGRRRSLLREDPEGQRRERGPEHDGLGSVRHGVRSSG